MELFVDTGGGKRNFSVRTTVIVLGVILLLAFYLRFFGFPNRFGIGGDSARDAFVASYGAKAIQFPLTGPFSSLGAFTFGPWYYWQLIVFDMVVNVPFAPWIYMSLASIGFILVMFLIGAELYGPVFGLIAAFLATVSPPQISSAKGLTNPNLISLFAGLSFYFFIMLLKKNNRKPWYGFTFGLFLGIGVNIHYQMINLLVLIPVLLLMNPKLFIQLVWAGIGFGVACLPMLFFDLNNHWYTVRNMSYLYLHGKEIMYIPNSWRIYLLDFWPQSMSYVFGLAKIPTVLATIFTLAALFFAVVKKHLTRPFIAVIAAFLLNFIMLRYYWGERFMGYLQYLYPYLFLFFAYAFWQIVRKHVWLGALLLVIYTVSAFPKIATELKRDEFHVWTNKLADDIKTIFPGKKFRIYTCKIHNWDQIQAITYYLHTEGLLDEKGVQIAFGKNVCGLPLNPHFNPSLGISKDIQLVNDYPTFWGDDGIILTEATAGAIFSSGYRPITPQAVYDTTVKWWYSEKP